jgi:hypothetical protein
MKTFIMIWLLAAAAACAHAQGNTAGFAEGILQSVENARVRTAGDALELERFDRSRPMKLTFKHGPALGIDFKDKQWWVLPVSAPGAQVQANRAIWVLPLEAASADHAWHVELENGQASAAELDAGLTVTIDAGHVRLTRAEARPHSDPFGRRFAFAIAGGKELADALAAFYWGTILPSVVERTMADKFPYSSGYVLSTLNVKAYAGSYPAVDHEFQIKGRLAMGSELDLDVVRRMIELQFKLMRDDPEHLYRAPCSVQPDGQREYHIRRNSQDNLVNAAMFPVTGNIEVLEEAWRYFQARKDAEWLQAHIEDLEHAAGWVLANTDQYGRVWGDVYYEDQVMKDGRATQAQAFAARNFELLAAMEKTLGRQADAERYAVHARQMASVLTEPLPMGYWDAKAERFVDWVDRESLAHDHIHLLANALPVLFGYATADEAAAVRRTIAAHEAAFERFPSFLAVDIAAYTRAEIGSGGPYDLSAAGRYWYWDAAFRQEERQSELLLAQLKAVAAEGAKSNYLMGERYDMDYVYYVDGKNAHGAEKYYEYPNVYAAVLIEKYLGLTMPADADIAVAPRLTTPGSVELGTSQYAVRYRYDESGFTLKNLAEKPRRFEVDLSGLGTDAVRWTQHDAASGAGTRFMIELPAQGEARWVVER